MGLPHLGIRAVTGKDRQDVDTALVQNPFDLPRVSSGIVFAKDIYGVLFLLYIVLADHEFKEVIIGDMVACRLTYTFITLATKRYYLDPDLFRHLF